jgi:hypothetical protein
MTLNCPTQLTLNTMSTTAPPALELISEGDYTRLVFCLDKYKLPQNYYQWKKMITHLKKGVTCTVANLIKEGDRYKDRIMDNIETSFDRCGFLATRILLEDLPPICLSESIIESFLKTEVAEMPTPEYPLPGFIFQIPSQCLSSISSVVNVYSLLVLPRKNSPVLDIVGLSDERYIEMGCGWDVSLKALDEINLMTNLNEPDMLEKKAPKDIEKAIMDSMTNVERIVKNAILVYTYEKKYITEPTESELSFSKGFKNDDTIRYMPFRWLGKEFKQTDKKHVCNEVSDERMKVRSHWRKGHWHTVCTGTKRKERQVRWFKPVFVNGD